MGGPQGGRPVRDARRLRPVGVAQERRHPWLVVRDPVGHEIPEVVEENRRILGEPVDDVARRPAALVLERLGQVPVVQRRQRPDPSLEHALDERPVEVEAALIRRPTSGRLDPRPRDREAVALEAERLHQVEILAPAVVVLARGVTRVAEVHLPLGGGEPVPDGLAAAVHLRRSLDLERSGRGPPDEPALVGHPFTAPFMIPPMTCRPSTRKITSSGMIEMKVPAKTSA